jgi:probable rRNA maturation factor
MSAAGDLDGAVDDDPGPRPAHVQSEHGHVDLLIEFQDWRELEGVEHMVHRAYEACAERISGIAGHELSIALSSDDAVAELNGRYRGKPKPTNVLSFPASGGPAAPDSEHLPLGDIIIAYETVMQEARAEDKPPLWHLAHLVVHGILHLAGCDHETDDDAEHMENLEREILASLGIPDPYLTPMEEQPVATG